MGRLYDAVQAVERAIAASGRDPSQTRGLIGMKAGFFLVIVGPDTPDDHEKLAGLRRASEEVLGTSMPF